MKNKMSGDKSLEDYLNNGVENIIKRGIKASLSNPKESIFMARYALASKKASKLRKESEQKGEHIPPFLIASITNNCNLHCLGCYARANQACNENSSVLPLSDEKWLDIFNEAKELGIGFILLAGGEPMMRTKVLEAAGGIQEILFPVFTNGTLINEANLSLFEKYRNLIPILSIEGERHQTDQRRGDGIYEKLMMTMEELQEKKILYGASVTVTTENIYNVTSDKFLNSLQSKGCKVIFYVEYVPVTAETQNLATTEIERFYLIHRLKELRRNNEDLLFISFPGDEKLSGGCLAAGRGFFHINAQGGAEPCPFSPYSDTNLKDVTLKQALQSPLFKKLQASNLLTQPHPGGCVLFEQEDKVKMALPQYAVEPFN